MSQRFGTETDLLNSAQRSLDLRRLHRPARWRVWTDVEVEGLFGVPDYVVSYGLIDRRGRKLVRSVAFELKLTDWRRALMQAFRYASFAHYAYVLMDDSFVARAVRHLPRFRRANIGLVSLSSGGRVKVHHRPTLRRPYSPELRTQLYNRVCMELF